MSLVSSLDLVEEERRARKLEAAKKKLKNFRATRTPSTSTSASHRSQPSGSSTKSTSSLASRSGAIPLTTENGGNISHIRVNSKGKGKMAERTHGESTLLGMGIGSGNGMGHERTRSGARASGGRHRRQNSSISGHSSEHSLYRPPTDITPDDDTRVGLRLNEYNFNLPVPVPREITMTPATPLLETHELSDPFSFTPPPTTSTTIHEEDVNAVKQRLTAFSFGSKPSLTPVSPSRSPSASPNRRQRLHTPLLPSAALRVHDLNFSGAPELGTTASVSAPAGLDKLTMLSGNTPSRPPSLLFTNATPLLPSPSAPNRLSHPSHPSLASIAGLDSPSPSTPPTPARKRHSHTRSNSISLSNLKLGGSRPISLGIPSSPSFPSSPGSPNSPDDASKGARAPISGTRLKFEPSEAEMAKEESRRKALEKLNGTSPAASPMMDEQPIAEIALPDLEDDTSSTTSSSRPLSGAWGSSSSFTSSSVSFGRPNSLNSSPGTAGCGYTHTSTPAMEPSPFPAWPADDATPMSFDRWSSGFKEENLGFGMEFMPPKRGSFQGGLSVLPEVEETEEENENEHDLEEKQEEGADNQQDDDANISVDHTYTIPIAVPAQTPTAQPLPSRLRELHLLSSGPIGTPLRPPSSTESSSSTSRARPAPISPTKGYGTIGRGRPRPLSGINASIKSSIQASSTSPLTAKVLTPQTARISAPRRRLSGSSRRSSISYKKDKDLVLDSSMSIGSSVSSRWSINSISNSRNMVSSPPAHDSTLASPPLSSPGGGSGWAHVPRSTNRPCPRPKSLVGLGIQSQSGSGSGSNRVLSEVQEKDEGDELGPGVMGLGDGWHSAPLIPTNRPFTFRAFGSMDMDLSSELEIGVRRSLDVDSEHEGRWRDNVLELEMDRDALREDVDGWRERCRGLEEQLEDEKRESGILRERMRKLSDRLLALSTTPHSPARPMPTTPAVSHDSRIVSEMKDQLFSLTSSFERERREKEAALQRIAQLEARLSDQSNPTPQWSFSPYESPPSTFEVQQRTAFVTSQTHSPAGGIAGGYKYPWPSTPIVTPATPAMLTPDHSALFASPVTGQEEEDFDGASAVNPCERAVDTAPDLNGYRMRAWGFPSTRPPNPAPSSPEDYSMPGTTTKASKRESFFGLSKIPQQALAEMVETETYDAGVDLPPFILPPHLSENLGPHPPPMSRAVSDPLPISPPSRYTSLHPQPDDSFQSTAMTKSASATSFSNSAYSLFSGYLPGRSSPTKIRPSELYAHSARGAEGQKVGGLDMRLSCRCCVGDVLEL